MKREDGIIELTVDEVRFLWREIYGDDVPDELSIKDAATTCLMTLGASKIEERFRALGIIPED